MYYVISFSYHYIYFFLYACMWYQLGKLPHNEANLLDDEVESQAHVLKDGPVHAPQKRSTFYTLIQ